VETGKEFKLFEARWDKPVYAVAFSPDGQQVLGAGGKVRTWDVRSGEPLTRFQGGGGVESAAFSRDGSQIAACVPRDSSRTGLRARRWDAVTGKPLACFEDPDRDPAASVVLAAVVPGSMRIVSTGRKYGVSRNPSRGMIETTAALLSVFGTLALSAALMPGGGFGYVIFDPTTPAFNPNDPYCLQV
jgi:WD40 repeat protein